MEAQQLAPAAGFSPLLAQTRGLVPRLPPHGAAAPAATAPAAAAHTLPDGRLHCSTALPLLAKRYRYLSTLGEGVSAQVSQRALIQSWSCQRATQATSVAPAPPVARPQTSTHLPRPRSCLYAPAGHPCRRYVGSSAGRPAGRHQSHAAAACACWPAGACRAAVPLGFWAGLGWAGLGYVGAPGRPCC